MLNISEYGQVIKNKILPLAPKHYSLKYNHLKSKMLSLGILKENMQYSEINPQIEVIYIQPIKKDSKKNVIEFDWIADWMDKKYPDLESFERYFAANLRKWKID